jgi:MFS family permease
MVSAAVFSAAAFCAFLLVSERAQSAQPAAIGRAKLPAAVLLPVTIAGTIWGAMNLACILFFSYAPLLMVAQGTSPTSAASLTSLAIWFTIVAIPTGGYLVHRSGAPTAAIIACAPVAAAALGLFVAGIHPTISCLIFGIAVGPLSGAILSLPAKVLGARERAVGFGVFYTCFYVLMAVGPSAAGRLQDIWGSPSAGLIAGAALLVAIVPLCLAFVSLSNPQRLAEIDRDAELRAAS